MKGLYKYPQAAFPYETLIRENATRSKHEPEFEILDTGVFNDNRYFDVFAEYAKATPDDMLITVTIANRSSEEAKIHMLPTFWNRNTWSWGCKHEGCWMRPNIRPDPARPKRLQQRHVSLGDFYIECETFETNVTGATLVKPVEWLLTDNETNCERVWGSKNEHPYVKDSFEKYVMKGDDSGINRTRGTKAAAYHVLRIPANGTATIRLRMYAAGEPTLKGKAFGAEFEKLFNIRRNEHDEFYKHILPISVTAEEHNVAVQAFAGLLWTKQFYHFIVADWLQGDPDQPTPSEGRKKGRNSDWPHLFNRDIISVCDKWEYPWYATWDLAFHTVAFAHVDPDFAKDQLLLFLREWYMHPNGALPAYEWNFSDVNPPVHAWAAWQIYRISGEKCKPDKVFLARVFQKLVINFTWWVNRKDVSGRHIFSGGFLGLDNIGVFDRSQPLPTQGYLEQADGTAWMALYCIYMLKMALELAVDDHVYEDVASKFFEHFLSIADAMNSIGGTGLWDERDGFYYDQVKSDHTSPLPLRIRSLVGLVPFFAVGVLSSELFTELPGFAKRTRWFLENRKDLAAQISFLELQTPREKQKESAHLLYLLAIPSKAKVQRVLEYVFAEDEFLSPYGIRSLSRHHLAQPYVLDLGGQRYQVDYSPGDSTTSLFGGNSNWRGPVWFPMNFLLIEALERLWHFYGDTFKVAVPTGTQNMCNMHEAANCLRSRLLALFLPDDKGRRPCHGTREVFTKDPHWKQLILFYEYFHGDSGRGLGASHQTGWTGLIVNCLVTLAKERVKKPVQVDDN